MLKSILNFKLQFHAATGISIMQSPQPVGPCRALPTRNLPFGRRAGKLLLARGETGG